jgi:CHAT domain-containing protein
MSNQIASLRRNLKSEDLDQLQKSRGRLAALILRGIGPDSPEKYKGEIAEREAEVQRLEANASARSNEYRSQSQPVTLEAVQQAIPPEAAVVEYVTYRPIDLQAKRRKERWQAARYLAYVLKRTGTPTWVELGDAETIDAEVRKFRAALRNRERADVRQLAHAVDLRVMRPLRGLLGNARHVFLSPDGLLNLVPFGALVDEDGHFLVEKYTFTYLTSARDLLRLQTPSKSRQEPLVIANPAFNLALSQAKSESVRSSDEKRRQFDFQGNFQPLTGTLAEGREIGKLLGVQPRVEEQATETLLKTVTGPSILHLATHGFFLNRQIPETNAARTDPLGNFLLSPTTDDGDNPLVRSGLALAGANHLSGGDAEDGVLTALEASGLDLWGTRLVVLSACESGLGDVQKGEGVYGLRRALVLAGAASQVVSLWKVDDEVTRDLMVQYYDLLLAAGKGRSEALRQVQREMIASKGKSTDLSHPYFWASFIQSGDWKNLDGRDVK